MTRERRQSLDLMAEVMDTYAQIAPTVRQALEESVVIEINHAGYRELLKREPDLKWYHIRYMEKNWILEKEPREVAFALDDAAARYRAFMERYPEMVERVPLRHIAANLGITPTQLSRIRKKNAGSQPV